MAEIRFYGNYESVDGFLIPHNLGSGIGFYGSDFGVSVPINARQDSTFITDALGTDQGAMLNNTKMDTIGDSETQGTVIVNGVGPIDLSKLPNEKCALNIRFTHDEEPVAVQNCKLKIFDRNNVNNHASGVSTYVYEARRPNNVTTAPSLSWRGRTEDTWFEFDPTLELNDMIFTASPGMSGLNTAPGDPETTGATTFEERQHRSYRHDWYVALSSEPETVGSKTQYGLYFSIEYL